MNLVVAAGNTGQIRTVELRIGHVIGRQGASPYLPIMSGSEIEVRVRLRGRPALVVAVAIGLLIVAAGGATVTQLYGAWLRSSSAAPPRELGR
jgi:hypothetical protein